MVWETRKVREETNHSRSPPFTYFPCCLLTSKTHQDARRPLMHYTKYPSHDANVHTTPNSRALVPTTQPLPSVSRACQHGHSQPREFGWRVLQ